MYLHLLFTLCGCFGVIEEATAVKFNAQDIPIDSLKYYEPLKSSEIRHRIVRRDANDEDTESSATHIAFKAHDREFHLNLVPEEELFSDKFRVVAVVDGKEEEVPYRRNEVLKGYVEGDHKSYVDGHYDGVLLTATIFTTDNVFYVEPSWRHINSTHDFDMIVYRHSDVLQNITMHGSGVKAHCANKGAFKASNDDMKVIAQAERKPRRRRDTVGGLDTCTVVLVADYKFYLHMGQQHMSQTVNYMISVMQRVNKIFQATSWNDNLKDIGFEVDEVKVHTIPGVPLYNEQKSVPWDADTLLTAFSQSNWSSACLAHLFTYHDFAKGVIGLAYVATTPDDAPGGICSRIYKGSSGQLRYLNSGLSSSLNWGRRLLTAEADIVTAHELGHNFGAEHDPETAQCAPSTQQGGKYIMYTTSVSGLNSNNKEFSVCSKTAIADVLNSKKNSCFKAKTGKFCGNFQVETGEMCDPGLDAVRGNTDPCCDRNCQLRLGTICSDANSECCDNCQFSAKTKLCREEFPLECHAATYCDGVNASCPTAPKLDGKQCYGQGTCANGICQSLCEIYKMQACSCGKGPNDCKICCQDSNGTSPCTALNRNNSQINHENGQPCDAGSEPGLCLNGKCQKSQTNVLDQFLSLVSDFSISKFAVFMKENIVGTILVFSLLLWIPAGCVISVIDKRREKEERDRQWWYDPKNTELMRKARDRNKKNTFFRNTGGRRMPRDIGTRMYGQPTAAPPLASRLELTDDYIVAV